VLENTKCLTGVAFPVCYQHSLPRQQRVVSLSRERALSPSLSLPLSCSLALALARCFLQPHLAVRAIVVEGERKAREPPNGNKP